MGSRNSSAATEITSVQQRVGFDDGIDWQAEETKSEHGHRNRKKTAQKQLEKHASLLIVERPQKVGMLVNNDRRSCLRIMKWLQSATTDDLERVVALYESDGTFEYFINTLCYHLEIDKLTFRKKLSDLQQCSPEYSELVFADHSVSMYVNGTAMDSPLFTEFNIPEVHAAPLRKLAMISQRNIKAHFQYIVRSNGFRRIPWCFNNNNNYNRGNQSNGNKKKKNNNSNRTPNPKKSKKKNFQQMPLPNMNGLPAAKRGKKPKSASKQLASALTVLHSKNTKSSYEANRSDAPNRHHQQQKTATSSPPINPWTQQRSHANDGHESCAASPGANNAAAKSSWPQFSNMDAAGDCFSSPIFDPYVCAKDKTKVGHDASKKDSKTTDFTNSDPLRSSSKSKSTQNTSSDGNGHNSCPFNHTGNKEVYYAVDSTVDAAVKPSETTSNRKQETTPDGSTFAPATKQPKYDDAVLSAMAQSYANNIFPLKKFGRNTAEYSGF